MSTWQACMTPQVQVPDSLDAVLVTQEPDTLLRAADDTAQPEALALPVLPADTLATNRHILPAEPVARFVQPADSLNVARDVLLADSLAIPDLTPRSLFSVCEADDEHADSLCTVWNHFQEPANGYFQNGPYWHPERPALHIGLSCRPLPYRVSTDSSAACAMLVCFVMLVYMLLRYGNEMRSQMHDFFLPARIRQEHHRGLSTAQGLLSMPYVCLMLSVMGSVGVSTIEQDRLALLTDTADRLALQGFYVAAWLFFFFLKANFYAFVNWIFFDKLACREWHDTLFHVLALECVLLFPVLLLMVYMSPSVQVLVWSVLSVIAFGKLLLLYKAVRLFSVKIYGALHLITYFCTFEVAPLWVELELLTHITDLL